MSYDTATPYIASYMLVRKDEKVAFLLRDNTSWMNGYYGLPAGKVEKNESYLQAAVRESKEEIGITVRPQDLRQVLVGHRQEQGEGMSWVDVFFEVTNYEGEAYNAEPDMHSELAWFPLDALPDNVIPSLRYMLEQLVAGKTYTEYWWPEGSDQRLP